MKNERYWLQDDSRAVVGYLEDYHQKWTLWDMSPIKQTWLRNFLAYYSPIINPGSWDTSLVFEGIQGELVRMYTPKARTLIRDLVTIATKQRLSFQAMAEAGTSDIIKDIKLANAIADQIVTQQRLDAKQEIIVEGALVCGQWFTKTIWRTDLGVAHTVDDNGNIIYTGGVEITCPGVFDVFYDINYPTWELVPWVEVRTLKNRWDLIAQHPDLETEIMQVPSISEQRGPNTWFDRTLIDKDSIYVYEFFCRPCPALPKGRMVIYASNQCVFYDDVNPYETLPVEPMCPEPILTTTMGYPQFSNILAAQEMYDNSLSAISTNQAQFAVQSVAIARGANINVQELNGMRFVSFTPQNVPGGGKPEPLQLSQTSPETFKFAEMLNDVMQDLSKINGAMRGVPPSGVTSGTAIATMAANALQFMESITKAIQQCMERTMFHAINSYKKFGKIEQNLTYSGHKDKMISRKFSGKDMQNISGVKILTANPLMQTISGRIEVAEKLLSMPKEIWPSYVSVLEGEPLRQIYKSEIDENDLIVSENEMLSDGQDVPALATDDHGLHVQKHAGLLNDPITRLNNSATAVILNHIEQHKNLAQNTDPILQAMVRTGKVPVGAMQQQQPPNVPPTEGGPLATPTENVAKPAQDLLQRG